MRFMNMTRYLIVTITAILMPACTIDDAQPGGKLPFPGAQPLDHETLASSEALSTLHTAGDVFGPFQLVADHSSKCLDVVGAGLGNGAAVQQWGCFSSLPANQLWYVVDTGIAFPGTSCRRTAADAST